MTITSKAGPRLFEASVDAQDVIFGWLVVRNGRGQAPSGAGDSPKGQFRSIVDWIRRERS